jgi:ABC-2 type transport system ATP-binding protein
MIEARGLTRTFTVKHETVEAVRGIDLDVREGEMVAVLGPNGAGKSTTLRMLTTLLRPTSGTARVVGHDVVDDPAGVRRAIGYIGQGTSAGHSQKVHDELVAQGRSYGMSRRQASRRGHELLEALDLGGLGRRMVSTLSGGQRRRLDVAVGMVHRPALLFLDEPSTGLDPQNRANLQEHVVALRDRHETTVVLTTHYLDEADALAERVVVVDHGRVVADDTPARLKASLAGDRVTLTLATPADAARAISRTRAVAESVTREGRTLELRVRDGDRVLPGLLRDLDAHGAQVVSVALARPTLDDVFLNLTGRSLREGQAAHDVRTTDTQDATERPTEEACA